MKKTLQYAFALLAVMALSTVCSQAQIEMPAKSPKGTVTQVVGLTDVEIIYSRPGVKGRKIFGGLLPYGDVWRTGANESTKITFSDSVTIGGSELAGGTYALYTIPNKDEWTIVLSNNTELWGDYGYTSKDDATRFTVTPEELPSTLETFTIQFDDVTANAAKISLMWENTKVSFPIETEVDSKVMAGIDRYVNNMAQNNANLYFQAASYYYEADKDLDQAMTWVNKALEGRPEAFYFAHLKAKILAKQENYDEAIATAQKSKEMAKAANSDDYIRLNEKAIAEWENMK